MIEHWWDIPVLAIAMAVGSWLGSVTSYWIKKKLGWIE